MAIQHLGHGPMRTARRHDLRLALVVAAAFWIALGALITALR